MEFSIEIPIDNDGFIRRECPNCMQQFKWHHGPANAEAEQAPPPTAYFCPLCGQPAGLDSWWTQEQLDFAEGVVMPAAMREINAELGRALRGSSNKFLSFKQAGHLDGPNGPMPLTEPDDMSIVASPCHAYEPVKVPDGRPSPFYCLVCGSAFAV